MSTFSGKQYKGAVKSHREIKRQEAEERNALTKPERRRQARLLVESLGQMARGEGKVVRKAKSK